MSFVVRHIIQRKANAFIVENHRHHDRVQGSIFQLGLYQNEELVGVAIVGRPSGRHVDKNGACELTRLCVKAGVKNGCSKLNGACSRVAREMGFSKIYTWILKSESGISLKASGWTLENDNCGGAKWNSSKKIKRTSITVDLFGEKKKYPTEKKQRWSKKLNSL